MVSDELFEAAEKIECYLKDPVFCGFYSKEMRDRIMRLCDEMRAIQVELDALPPN